MATVSLSRLRPTRSHAIRLAVVGVAAALPLVMLQSSSQAAPQLTIEQAQAQLSALQTKQDIAVEAFNQGQLAVTSAQQAVTTAQASVARQQVKVAAAQKQLSGFARAAYMDGTIDPVASLLAGQHAGNIVQQVGSLDQVARVRSSQGTALQAQQTQLSALQQVSNDKLSQAAAKEKQLATAKKGVDNLIAQQQKVLDGLQAKQRAELAAQAAAQAAADAKAKAQAAQQISRALAAPRPSSGAQPASFAAASAPAGPAPSGPSSVASTVLRTAYAQIGKPYQYGAAGPNSYDCSGLVLYSFAAAGISLPHGATDQYNYGTHVSVNALQPGDVVFFGGGGYYHHNGIYVGNGNMIDAPHTGTTVGVHNMAGYGDLAAATRIG